MTKFPSPTAPVGLPARARELPREIWKADGALLAKYHQMNHPVGPIYDAVAVAFLKRKGIAIPPPTSVYEPWMLFNEQFFKYWEDVEIHWNEDAFAYALRRVRRAFEPMKGLQMATFGEVESDILSSNKTSRSAGLPTLSTKKDALPSDLGRAKAIATGRVEPPPAIAFYRTQEDKVRLVWGFPLSIILLEGRFMLPIQERLRQVEVPYVFGYHNQGQHGRLNPVNFMSYQLCLDWSKFDSTVPHRIINTMFRVVFSWFDEYDAGIADIVRSYFATSPIVMPDGYVYKRRRRGVPSGSFFTQLIDSMCNMFLTEYVSYVTKTEIGTSIYYGDDSVIGLRRRPDVSEWGRAARKLGMRVSAEKHTIAEGEPYFLGRNWKGITTSRQEEKIYSSLATSERYIHFRSKEERMAYRVQKAKSLLIDAPNMLWFIAEYFTFLFPEKYAGNIAQAAYSLIVGSESRVKPTRVGVLKKMDTFPHLEDGRAKSIMELQLGIGPRVPRF